MNSVYIVGCERASGKSAVALGVHALMASRLARLGVFRPVVDTRASDPLLTLLRSRGAGDAPQTASIGVSYEEVSSDQDAAIEEIVARFRSLARACDGVLVVGSDYMDPGAPVELAFNARVAANLGVPALGVVSGVGRSCEEVLDAVELALESLREADCDVEGLVANRVERGLMAEVSARTAGREPPVYVLPEVAVLAAPTVEDLLQACSGELIGVTRRRSGSRRWRSWSPR